MLPSPADFVAPGGFAARAVGVVLPGGMCHSGGLSMVSGAGLGLLRGLPLALLLLLLLLLLLASVGSSPAGPNAATACLAGGRTCSLKLVLLGAGRSTLKASTGWLPDVAGAAPKPLAPSTVGAAACPNAAAACMAEPACAAEAAALGLCAMGAA